MRGRAMIASEQGTDEWTIAIQTRPDHYVLLKICGLEKLQNVHNLIVAEQLRRYSEQELLSRLERDILHSNGGNHARAE